LRGLVGRINDVLHAEEEPGELPLRGRRVHRRRLAPHQRGVQMGEGAHHGLAPGDDVEHRLREVLGLEGAGRDAGGGVGGGEGGKVGHAGKASPAKPPL